MKEDKEGSWSIKLDDVLLIDGFEDQREAGAWILEYNLRVLRLAVKKTAKDELTKTKREERRKILGAALLEITERIQ
jgi:hypothetical protein